MTVFRQRLDDLLLRLLSREAIAAIVAVILQVTDELSPEVAGPLAALILGRSVVKGADRLHRGANFTSESRDVDTAP